MKHVKWSRLVCCRLRALLLSQYRASRGRARRHDRGITGIVKDTRAAVIPGPPWSRCTRRRGRPTPPSRRPTGRFTIPGMRVGGPYKVTADVAGFTSEEKGGVALNLGVSQDLEFTLKIANVAETITVVGQSDPVFSSGRTGAATAVLREDLATLPTVSGRITDITRLTPQYGGSGTFAGQDNRANNITVDGSYFNNSFGLGVTTGGIGDRTGVAPISLEAIEQVQVSVAPYDVRQGSFTGAGVNTVTRSGTNDFTASAYHRTRNQDCSVGTKSARPVSSARLPGTLQSPNFTTGARVGRRSDRQEQAVRVRRLRETGRHAAAHDVHARIRAVRRLPATPRGCWRRISTASPGVSEREVQLRHRPVRQHPEAHAGKAVDAEGRLQRQQRQQGDVPLQPARLEQPDSISPGRRALGTSRCGQLDAVPDALPTRTTRSSRI